MLTLFFWKKLAQGIVATLLAVVLVANVPLLVKGVGPKDPDVVEATGMALSKGFLYSYGTLAATG